MIRVHDVSEVRGERVLRALVPRDPQVCWFSCYEDGVGRGWAYGDPDYSRDRHPAVRATTAGDGVGDSWHVADSIIGTDYYGFVGLTTSAHGCGFGSRYGESWSDGDGWGHPAGYREAEVLE
jgi:hypothetical protein